MRRGAYPTHGVCLHSVRILGDRWWRTAVGPPLTQFLIGRENGSEGGSMEHEGFSPSGGRRKKRRLTARGSEKRGGRDLLFTPSSVLFHVGGGG